MYVSSPSPQYRELNLSSFRGVRPISLQYLDLFHLCPPPPVRYVPPFTEQGCHYMVNHYVQVRHVRLRGANNNRPLSLGGTNGEDPKILNIAIKGGAPGV